MARSTQLGRFIRSRRDSLRFTSQRVEELSLSKPHFERISPAVLVDIEHGRRVPTFAKVLTLAEILDVPLHHFEERFRLDREGDDAVQDNRSRAALRKEAGELEASGNYRDALAHYKRARKIDEENGAREGLEIEIRIACCRRRLGMLRVAKEDLERVLASAQITDDQRVRALATLAEVNTLTGNPYVAKLYLRSALALARKKNFTALLPGLHTDLGNAYYRNSESVQALAAYRRALDGYKRQDDRRGVAMSFGNIANCSMLSGRHEEAEQLNKQCLKIALEVSSMEGIATAHCNLAQLYLLMDKKGKSRACAAEALRVAREGNHHDLICRASYVLWEVARQDHDAIQERLNYNILRRHTRKLEFKLPALSGFYEYQAYTA